MRGFVLQSVAQLFVLGFRHCSENAYDQMFSNAGVVPKIMFLYSYLYKRMHAAWIREA